ncbi:hypothetical protein G7Y89_g5552 [Cudoniella acicularis]|uniref:Heterokaryon incompatibility domain-containing protein n=1 Tax=Cudoniella acicularis TaxID=354080 RepID=A0A8H4RPG4_9HELO|nr:hypothetical protein G7Y89_g5552 [Cudoniella acicularis]
MSWLQKAEEGRLLIWRPDGDNSRSSFTGFELFSVSQDTVDDENMSSRTGTDVGLVGCDRGEEDQNVDKDDDDDVAVGQEDQAEDVNEVTDIEDEDCCDSGRRPVSGYALAWCHAHNYRLWKPFLYSSHLLLNGIHSFLTRRPWNFNKDDEDDKDKDAKGNSGENEEDEENDEGGNKQIGDDGDFQRGDEEVGDEDDEKSKEEAIYSAPDHELDEGELAVRLPETKGMRGRYICLSHCWGGFQPACITKRATLASNLAGIAWDALPMTFQHAVTTTSRLGFEYIWIDSICIVQDDADDWRLEAAEMANIYENAALTLAATSPPNSEGLFSSSSSQAVRGHRGVVVPGELECFEMPDVVRFTNTELVWECLDGFGCECSTPHIGSGGNPLYDDVLPSKVRYGQLVTTGSYLAALERNSGPVPGRHLDQDALAGSRVMVHNASRAPGSDARPNVVLGLRQRHRGVPPTGPGVDEAGLRTGRVRLCDSRVRQVRRAGVGLHRPLATTLRLRRDGGSEEESPATKYEVDLPTEPTRFPNTTTLYPDYDFFGPGRGKLRPGETVYCLRMPLRRWCILLRQVESGSDISTFERIGIIAAPDDLIEDKWFEGQKDKVVIKVI